MYSLQEWYNSGAALNQGGGGDPGGPISQSLRFRGTHLQMLSFDSFPSTDNIDACFSFWMKLGVQTTSTTSQNEGIICYGAHASDAADYRMGNDNYMYISKLGRMYRPLRDYSGWYHVYIQYKPSERDYINLYINGELVDYLFHTHSDAFNGSLFQIGNTIGLPWNNHQFVGYLADYQYVYGKALTPRFFGRYNSNGVWVPVDLKKDGDTDYYGVNGFHLTFADPDNVGKDYSGNGNDFTATGFETSDPTSPNYDIMLDSPTNNFATGNPFHAHGILAKGNLALKPEAIYTKCSATIELPDTGRYYWECSTTDVSIDKTVFAGMQDIDLHQITGTPGNSSSGPPGIWMVASDASINTDGVPSTNPNGGIASNSILGFRYDRTNDELRVYQNGVIYHTFALPDPDGRRLGPFLGTYNSEITFNFGQQPFRYKPPSGFKALSTANMPAAPVADGRDHYFNVLSDAPDALNEAQLMFPSGLWWIRDRNDYTHIFVDAMNGTESVWFSPSGTGGVEYTAPPYTEGNRTFAFSWKAGDSDVANTDGTIPSTVRANPQAGFSIVQWTGTQTAGSVGHGLNGTPDFVFATGYSGLIPSWHSAANPVDGYFYINKDLGWTTNQDIWNSEQMSSTTLGVSSNAITNQSGQLMTAYVWTAIPGYSDFGYYTGNGLSEGPFVYLGFRPAFLMVKSTDTGDWFMYRNTHYNPRKYVLFANLDEKEIETSGGIDFLCNGFRIVGEPLLNENVAYIYAAFADNPFQSPSVPT